MADQNQAELREVLAPALATFYKALVANDFTPDQAIVLTVQYMHKAIVQVVVVPPKESDQAEDDDARGNH